MKWQPGDLGAPLCYEGHKKAVVQSLLAGSLEDKDTRSAPGLARRLGSRNGVGSVCPDSPPAMSRAVMVLSLCTGTLVVVRWYYWSHRAREGSGGCGALLSLMPTPCYAPGLTHLLQGIACCVFVTAAPRLWLLPASTTRWDEVSAQQSPSSRRSTGLS